MTVHIDREPTSYEHKRCKWVRCRTTRPRRSFEQRVDREAGISAQRLETSTRLCCIAVGPIEGPTRRDEGVASIRAVDLRKLQRRTVGIIVRTHRNEYVT